MRDEYWALRGAEIWTENGRLIATYINETDAKTAVDDHNMEIELNEPEPPEVQKTQEQDIADRIAMYRREEPEGARLLSQISEGAARTLRLLSLKAPEIVIADAAESRETRIAVFRALHPGSLRYDEGTA